jgi:predicted outer membrane repeat protein
MKNSKLKILILLLTILSTSLYAQTVVPGGTVSGVWNSAGSPYLVQGAIMIANGTTLTIEPGVVVEFQGSYKLLVMGQILAQGNETDSICFTTTDTTVGWLGIRFDNTSATNDSSKFSYCVFSLGKTVSPIGNGGALSFTNFSKASISRSRISHCMASYSGGAIYLSNSNIIVEDCLISNNTALTGGGIGINNSNAIIRRNTIVNNTATASMECGGGISSFDSEAMIDNNIISGNTGNKKGGGIYCYGDQSTFSNNIITNNFAVHGGGIYTISGTSGITIINNIIANNSASQEGGGIACEACTITNTLIANNTAGTNGGGIISYSLVNKTITNATIVNNLAQNGGAVCCAYSSPSFINCIFWNDSASISGKEFYLTDESSDPSIIWSDVEGGSGIFGTPANVFYTGTYSNNLDTAPEFRDPSPGTGVGYEDSLYNWSLLASSPCINAGNPSGSYVSQDIEGNPRICDGVIDMGAYEVSLTDIRPRVQSSPLFYPNPFDVSTRIDFGTFRENAIVHIYSIDGQLMRTWSFSGNQLEVSNLKAGLYFVQIKESNQNTDCYIIVAE